MANVIQIYPHPPYNIYSFPYIYIGTYTSPLHPKKLLTERKCTRDVPTLYIYQSFHVFTLIYLCHLHKSKIPISQHQFHPKFEVRRERHFFFTPSSNYSKSPLLAEMDVVDSHNQKSSPPHSIVDAEKVEKKPGGWRAVSFILGMCFSLVRERNLFLVQPNP